MAEKLTSASVKLGRLIAVTNQHRRQGTNDVPVLNALWIEDSDGGNERCIMLSPRMLKAAEYLAQKNPEDIPSRSLLSRLTQ